jgi:dTDP-4-amino-4,6-dideoxygalactose transaminase
MAVPMLDIKAQNSALKPEIMRSLEAVVDSGGFILGAQVEALEKELAALTGAKHAVGVSSGTDAILVALMALGVGPGDEVLVPAFTFFATAGCVSRLGATPVFVDSRLEDFNMSPADLERKIGPRSKAIMPVHLFGQCAPMGEILKIAAAHGLPVIEDAAQAMDATCPAGRSCSMGAIGVTSFYPTKNLGAMGDAGMLFTNDDSLADKCSKLRNHGMSPRYYHAFVGGNFRLDAMQAAVLRVKRPHLAGYSAARAANAAAYAERLAGLPGVAFAGEAAAGRRLVLPRALAGNGHVWNQFTVRVPGAGRRDALKALLSSRGIGCDIYYPLTLDMQECFKGCSKGGESCSVAHALAGEVLSLPVYPEMPGAALGEVAEALVVFISGRA